MQDLQPLIDSLQGFAQKRLNFERPPKLFLKQDEENAQNVLGKTAFYDPQEESVTLFISNRHPKDILRSLAHELVHHTQNLRGDLSPEKCGEMGMGYAQNNSHMREMEREAYEKGNMCFRDWEDNYKTQINTDNVTINLKENKKMVKISRKELKGLITKLLSERTNKKEVNELNDVDKFLKATQDISGSREAKSQKRNLARIGMSMEELQSKVGAKQTGEYDLQTNRAIKSFQKKVGVSPDGIFGPATLDAATDARIGGEDRGMVQRTDFDAEGRHQFGDDMYADDDDQELARMDDEEGFMSAPAKPGDTSIQGAEDDLMAAAGVAPPDRSFKMPGLAKTREPEDFETIDIGRPGLSTMAKSRRDPTAGAVAGSGIPGMPAEEEPYVGKVPPATEMEIEPIDVEREAQKIRRAKAKKRAGIDETRTQTPESEKALNESMFGKKNNEIFNRLKALWAK